MKFNIIDKLIMATLGLLAPLSSVFIAVLILIIADWITGIWKSLKCKRRLTSYRLRLSVTKIVTYFLAIYLAALVNDFLMPGLGINTASYVAAYIGVTELISVFENISVITGKRLLRDLAALLMESLKQKFKLSKGE